MSAATLAPPHPVLVCVDALGDALREVAHVEPVFMTTADKQTALVRLAQVESMVHELRLRVLAGADEVGDQSGARDSAAWLSSAAQLDTKAARADRHLAKALDQHPRLAAGMRAGTVSPAQAHIILNGLDDLPGDVDDAVAAAAEHELVGYCADFRPRELRRLTRRLLEVLDPDGAEAAEGSRLEAEERRARERASLRFRDLGNGRTRLWGVLPTPVAQRFEHYLQAYTSPRRRPDEATSPTDAPLVDGRRVPRHRAYAHALAALLENIDPDGLPLHGGDATSVFVTMTLDQVRNELATAGVLAADGESEISATDARRLACQATHLPVVLGGRGEVLDLGRAQRLHRPAQRKAIRLRDRGCRAEGCTTPAAWCEIHHRTPWAQGGSTTVDDAACLCPHHHHRIHDPAYSHEWLSSGAVRYHRRQ